MGLSLVLQQLKSPIPPRSLSSQAGGLGEDDTRSMLAQRASGTLRSRQEQDEAAAGVGRIAEQHSAAFQHHPIRSQHRRRQAERQRARRPLRAIHGLSVAAPPSSACLPPCLPARNAAVCRRAATGARSLSAKPPHSRLVCLVAAQEGAVLEAGGDRSFRVPVSAGRRFPPVRARHRRAFRWGPRRRAAQKRRTAHLGPRRCSHRAGGQSEHGRCAVPRCRQPVWKGTSDGMSPSGRQA